MENLLPLCATGSTYITDFASLSVAWNFLDRPIFNGVPFSLVWGKELQNKRNFTIGNSEWKKINKLGYNEFLIVLLLEKDFLKGLSK